METLIKETEENIKKEARVVGVSSNLGWLSANQELGLWALGVGKQARATLGTGCLTTALSWEPESMAKLALL